MRIEGLKQPLLSKRTGTVILLNEDDPNCRRLMLQIEEKSPFPSRWDPAYDDPSRVRIASMAESVMGELWQYEPELRSLPPRSEELASLASIFEPNTGLVTTLLPAWRQELEASDAPAIGDLYVRGNVIVKGDLSGRLVQNDWALPANLVTEDWFGQSFRFIIGVDERGIVRSCVPLPGGSMGGVRATDRQKNLAVWLRAQRLKAADKAGTTFGELHIQIEATRE
ncbi:MAG: hypothetical protein AB8F34_08250 [Akkermansiaceae bacterium]